MFWNHIKITLRSFKRNKAYTLLNILGLTSGLAVFTLITLYVNHEFSYDQYHKHKDRIYHVYQHVPLDRNINMAVTPAPLAPTLMADFPEVVYASGIGQLRNTLIKVNNQTFLEPAAYYTNPDAFKMFSFEVIEGDISSFMTKKHTVVLSASSAIKYFGKTDVLGEVIYYQNEHPMQVVGVIKDMPSNSHFRMDIILQYETILDVLDRSMTDWGGWAFWTYTYVMLEQNTNLESFQAKILGLRAKYGSNPADEDATRITYHVHPLTQIHFTQDMGRIIAPVTNTTQLYVYLGIAFMILTIASINYINLATARAMKRMKEIGIRKVVGAQNKNLIFQFFTESLLLVFISLLISLLCLLLILPSFSQFVDRELVLNFLDPMLWLYLGGLFLGLGLLSGTYPALILISFKPVSALKGKIQQAKSAVLRNILVVFQFTISAVLILGTLVVSKQLNYVQNADVGYARDQIVVLNVRDESVRKQLPVFNEELRSIAGVVNVALSNSLPGSMYVGGNLRFPGMENRVHAMMGKGDYDFLDLYEFEVVRGRSFSREIESDKTAILLNESAAKALGWEDSIDEQMSANNVIGILKDFHQHSLHREIRPALFSLDETGNRPGRYDFISIKITGNQLKETLTAIESKYNRFSPEFPFEYNYYDDLLARAYLTEIKTAKLINWFAGLTILVACLGLYGLAAYRVEQRIKEVGIRKVLGASIPKILTLLSKDFVRLLVIAFLVAAPVAYYVMDGWLTNFAYHISIGAFSFAFTLVMMILIAGLAVGHRTYKAAVRNPVESLRDE